VRPTLALAALAATAALATAELATRHAAARSRLPLDAAAAAGAAGAADAAPLDAAAVFSQDVDPSWAAFLDRGLEAAAPSAEPPLELAFEERALASDPRDTAAAVPEPPTLVLAALAALGLALRRRHQSA
jgi:hypothetical protein